MQLQSSASVSSKTLAFPFSRAPLNRYYAESTARILRPGTGSGRRRPVLLHAVNEVSGAVLLDPAAPVQITWQIVVGAAAGVAPFVVAGVEFSKRIAAQRRCKECCGSGLVMKETAYFRCPSCGGFLPWQSWRRFFSG